MPSDPSNARDALRDPAASEQSDEASSTSSRPSGKNQPAPARILSEPPSGMDAEDEGRSLLSELTVGSVVDGKYRVDEVLGRGAMGVVVAATHVHLSERVALKFLRYRAAKSASASTGDDFQSRFKREARVSAKLKNEHITRVIDVGVWHQQVPYMVMDYLTGDDLRQVIKQQGPLPVGVALDYVVQICTGIAEAHAHAIVHRDLKPSNLFVTRRPDGSDIIKILDFGISKWNAGEPEIDELTQTGVVLGSPKYMAPEQLFGSSEVDARADVWSIGAILYEMLCGRPPFDLPSFTKICAELATDHMPPSLHERRPEVSPELDAVVMRCFVRDPARRMPNVAELAGAVLEAVQAPFSTQIRQKIAAMLDPRGARDPLAVSSGRVAAMSTGSYPSVVGTTGGSARGVTVDTQSSARSTSSSPRLAAALEASGSERHVKRRPTGWIVLVGLVLIGGGLFYQFGYRAKANDEHRASAGGPSAGATTASTVAATATAPVVTDTATATATSTTTATATPAASASASAAATTEHTTHPGSRGGGWHAPVHGAPPPPPTTAATTATPPPAPPPQPVATTPPAPTPKTDPLGDRQ